jgi:hypothetical protein
MASASYGNIHCLRILYVTKWIVNCERKSVDGVHIIRNYQTTNWYSSWDIREYRFKLRGMNDIGIIDTSKSRITYSYGRGLIKKECFTVSGCSNNSQSLGAVRRSQGTTNTIRETSNILHNVNRWDNFWLKAIAITLAIFLRRLKLVFFNKEIHAGNP